PRMVRSYTEEQLNGFRDAQRLAYECAVAVAGRLREGVTETQAADALEAAVRERGVDTFFHRPFAWFGDRAAFRGFLRPTDFVPRDRKLVADEPAILDVAPIVNGYTADIGYSFMLGDDALCPAFARVKTVLRTLREHIVREVRAGRTMRAIYRSVDEVTSDA